jgi:hypothetical protein
MKALATLLVMGMAVPATAAQQGDSGKPDKPRQICTRDYASQTRLGSKVCRPAEEKRAKAAPAAAATAAKPVQVASAGEVTATAPKKEKKICKRQESSVSRLGGGPRICKTAAEWRGLPAQDDSEKLLMHEAKGR